MIHFFVFLCAFSTTDKPYTLSWQVMPLIKTQQNQPLTLVISPQHGLSFKKETPFKAKFLSPQKIAFKQTEFSQKDLQKTSRGDQALKTTFQVSMKGTYRIQAELSFFLCSQTLCERYSDTAEVEVKAE